MRPGCWYGTLAYDRGTHFTAEIIQELMVLVGTNHVLTLAASKQENAAVENANYQTILFTELVILKSSLVEVYLFLKVFIQSKLTIVAVLQGQKVKSALTNNK